MPAQTGISPVSTMCAILSVNLTAHFMDVAGSAIAVRVCLAERTCPRNRPTWDSWLLGIPPWGLQAPRVRVLPIPQPNTWSCHC